ncbi:MAG: PAC2 family protein [Candidatus Diapherotrites archaeon]
MSTEIKFFKEMKFKNAVLFTGLPGIGLVGKICVDYMLKQLKAQKVAEITSDSFPPSVHTEHGLIDLIKDELYYATSKGRDCLFLAGPVQPSLDMRIGGVKEHYEFAQAIVDKLSALGVTEIVTLAGINIGEKRMSSAPKVVAAATKKEFIAEWKKIGAIADRPEGLISGAAGLVLGIAKERGIHGTCLMGQTNARLVYGDHGAAKEILKLLVKKYDFKIDMGMMEKEAKQIEAAFTALAKQFEEREEKPPAEGLSYVR